MDVEDPKKSLYLKLLLNRSQKGSQDPTLKFLPAKSREDALKHSTLETKLDLAVIFPPDYLNKIHYSWLKKVLEELPKEEAPYYLSALDKKKRDEILRIFPVEKDIQESKGFVKGFIQRKWIEKLVPADFIPLPFLPKSDLDSLYSLSKNELIELIAYVGLYDLAHEMKKVVDTKVLKNIYGNLNPLKLEYLKSLLQQKEKISTPKFDLKDWSGDIKDLENRLHKRGLRRLHLALAKEHPSKKWLISRTLDTGRGLILIEPIHEEINPHIIATLTGQVLDTLKFLGKVNRG